MSGKTSFENNESYRYHLERSNFILAPTMILRIRAIKELGGYDESLGYEDWDCFLRFSKSNWKIQYNPKCLVYYRRHANSMWNSLNPISLIATFDIFQKHGLYKISDSILHYMDHFRKMKFRDKRTVARYLFKQKHYTILFFFLLKEIKFIRVARFRLYKLICL